jgi:hypothetical protein
LWDTLYGLLSTGRQAALPRVDRASAKLAAAFQIVLDTTSEQVDTDTGEIAPPEVETLEAMWEWIEQVVPGTSWRRRSPRCSS